MAEVSLQLQPKFKREIMPNYTTPIDILIKIKIKLQLSRAHLHSSAPVNIFLRKSPRRKSENSHLRKTMIMSSSKNLKLSKETLI
jgi:hypothetical protein